MGGVCDKYQVRVASVTNIRYGLESVTNIMYGWRPTHLLTEQCRCSSHIHIAPHLDLPPWDDLSLCLLHRNYKLANRCLSLSHDARFIFTSLSEQDDITSCASYKNANCNLSPHIDLPNNLLGMISFHVLHRSLQNFKFISTKVTRLLIAVCCHFTWLPFALG